MGEMKKLYIEELIKRNDEYRESTCSLCVGKCNMTDTDVDECIKQSGK